MICYSPMINGDLQSLANHLNPMRTMKSESLASKFVPRGPHTRQHNSTLHHIPNQIYLQIGLVMDNTLSTLELDLYYQNLDSTMLYVSDPLILTLNNGHGKSISIEENHDQILPYKGDVLIIEGENLAVLLLSENELNVTIGIERCNLTSIDMRQIVCQPPPYPPAPTDELGRRNSIDLPVIVLKIGNMRKQLGYIHYGDYFYGFKVLNGFGHENDPGRFYHQNHPPFSYNGGSRFESSSSASSSSIFNIDVLIFVSIFIGIILTIISVIILAAYRHKTNEAEREYKRIQLQMDTLESNVRSECKQAFAELQTDILQSSGLLNLDDLSQLTLPINDDRTFLLRMIYASGKLIRSQLISDRFEEIFWFQSPYFHFTKEENQSCSRDIATDRTLSSCSTINNPTIIVKDSLKFDEIDFLARNDRSNYHLYRHQNGQIRNGLDLENYYTSQRYNSDRLPMSAHNFINTSKNNPRPIMMMMPNSSILNRNNLMGHDHHYSILEQFERDFLCNRNFVLIMIDCLEQQLFEGKPSKQSNPIVEIDRQRLASLLMLSLLDRMDYLFDIIRSLLESLIDRSLSNKNHSKLFENNQNSIVEKMLIDWLSICLLKYSKEIASEPLFLLQSAIKHQIDRGPVDYITGSSRFVINHPKSTHLSIIELFRLIQLFYSIRTKQ